MSCSAPRKLSARAAITKLARVDRQRGVSGCRSCHGGGNDGEGDWQPPVVQAYDWTGLYVGGHLGYAWGRSNWSAHPISPAPSTSYQSSDIFNGSGSYFGGLQIGYDVMLANRVVLGVQVDSSFPGFPNLEGISIGGFSIFLHAGARPGEL